LSAPTTYRRVRSTQHVANAIPIATALVKRGKVVEQTTLREHLLTLEILSKFVARTPVCEERNRRDADQRDEDEGESETYPQAIHRFASSSRKR
jgi:hypothetical protein